MQAAWKRVLAEVKKVGNKNFMDFIETQLETAARAVASLEAQVNQEEEGEVKGGDLSDQESLSVCHLGCAGPTMNGLVTKTIRMKRDVVGNLGNLGSDFLEAEVDGGLLEVGGQLEGLVKASQTYGQLR